ncbi:MAG: FMN-binding negative transcriptional regulator [Chloroflexi bacterium]|nr:FMN-binding negative transcriptional regulator [Chloroflexota bacterium]
MYIPSSNKEDNLDALHNLIRAYNFATLITSHNGTPFATHIPFMLDDKRGPYGTLVGHMARANPQWQYFTTVDEVLVIFQGPHAYISPSWYTGEFNVPTWNYAVAHAYGCPKIIEELGEIQQLLDRLVDNHESSRPQPWAFTWSERHINLTKAIVAFEIEITKLEGKFKLSQNRSQTDQQQVIDGLNLSTFESDRAVAELMRIGAQSDK